MHDVAMSNTDFLADLRAFQGPGEGEFGSRKGGLVLGNPDASNYAGLASRLYAEGMGCSHSCA